jgi:hypothetical protein
VARDPQTAKIGRAMREKLSQMLSDVMIAAADSVTRATPVDTGHAMSNWILSTGSPYAGIAGSRESVSFSEQAAGVAKIQRYDIGRDGKIYLKNNVDYMRFLAGGSSQQATRGWITIALQQGARLAPRGSKGRVRTLLRAMSKQAYRKGV